MGQKKYTLPRHTNLAKQGTRTSAFLVDLAIGILLTIFFVFAVFRPIFKNKINSYNAKMDSLRLESGLYIENDNGKVDTFPGNQPYKFYLYPLEDFYCKFMRSESIPEQDRKEYTIKWFNENVLKIGVADEYQCFKYDQTGGVDDPSKIGVLIDDTKEDNAKVLLQKQYKIAILEVFNSISSVAEAGAKFMTLSTTIYVVSIFLAGATSYVIIPWILKDGQTLGKKIFKLGLADADGYKFHNHRLLMRFMPFLVVNASLMFFVLVNLYIVLSIVAVVFLVSFTLAMSSPKRMSLHDFTAQTIVVDLKTSKIFATVEQEEEYVLHEDHLLDDVMPESDGEEPELRYEK